MSILVRPVPLFVSSLPLQPLHPLTHAARTALAPTSPLHDPRPRSRPRRCRFSPSASAASDDAKKPVLKVGQIVAVQRSSTGPPDIARVTGAASSGQTVDIQLLEPFVKELYIDSKDPPTYAQASSILPVPSEYVSSQSGWIVLDQDLVKATDIFAKRVIAPPTAPKESITLQEADKPAPPSPDALQRQFFRPTRTQAFLASALSVSLSAGLYAAFITARTTFESNPAGNDLLHGNFFRTLILFNTAAASLASIVVGSALFLYALSSDSSSSNGDSQ